MKQWEYKTMNLRTIFNASDFLEDGKNGWELVTVVPIYTGGYKAVFKREKEQPKDEGWNYCKDIKPSGYDDALPKYFQVAVKYLIASGTQTVTDITQACYFQENDKWYIHENDPEPLYDEVYAWRELPNKPQLP